VLTAQVCAAQQPPATQPQQIAKADAGQSQTTSSSVSATAIPSYPDTPNGLEDLMNEMLKLEKKHDAKALAPYVESLELPNAGTWFRATFGDEIGAQLADSYDRARMNLPLAFPDLLEQLNSKHFTKPVAMLLTESCNPDASADEYEVLVSRKSEQPLFDVRLTSYLQRATVSYFAYVDGAFRYLSNFGINPAVSRPPEKTIDFKMPGAIPIKGNILQGRITKQVTPVYPFEAKASHIQGNVILHAIIGENGNVCNLRVIAGNPLLAASAMAAVRQWHYAPYKLNGQPVKVDTTITVIFNLGR
jgi:TonB family protein